MNINTDEIMKTAKSRLSYSENEPNTQKEDFEIEKVEWKYIRVQQTLDNKLKV